MPNQSDVKGRLAVDPSLGDKLNDWLSFASLWMPERIVPSAWHEHGPFAFWLIQATRPAKLVELGTHMGFSHLAFCQAVHRLGLDTTCYAVDTWHGDEHAGFYGEEVFTSLQSYHNEHYSGFSQLIRSTFDEAVSYFPDRSIDLLHIDGLHSYEDVKHDFSTWSSKLSDRAIVLFHDVNVRERDFGVWKFWQELRPRYPGFVFEHGHGLGILGYGKDIPAAVKLLFTADRKTQSHIRSIYARLGAAVTDRHALTGSRQERRDLHNVLKARDSDLIRLQELVAARNAQLVGERDQVAAFKAKIALMEATLAATPDTQLAQARAQIAAVRAGAASQLAIVEAALAEATANRERADEIRHRLTIVLRQQAMVVARLRSENSIMQQFFDTSISGLLLYRLRDAVAAAILRIRPGIKEAVPAPIKNFIRRRILKTGWPN
jgi:hypothetical protein